MTETFVNIDANTLDNLSKILKLKQINLIKIDIDGPELEVLMGAKNILGVNHPKIVFEAMNKESLDKITEFLSKFSYSVKNISGANYYAC